MNIYVTNNLGSWFIRELNEWQDATYKQKPNEGTPKLSSVLWREFEDFHSRQISSSNPPSISREYVLVILHPSRNLLPWDYIPGSSSLPTGTLWELVSVFCWINILAIDLSKRTHWKEERNQQLSAGCWIGGRESRDFNAASGLRWWELKVLINVYNAAPP